MIKGGTVVLFLVVVVRQKKSNRVGLGIEFLFFSVLLKEDFRFTGKVGNFRQVTANKGTVGGLIACHGLRRELGDFDFEPGDFFGVAKCFV